MDRATFRSERLPKSRCTFTIAVAMSSTCSGGTNPSRFASAGNVFAALGVTPMPPPASTL
jgi:hypothetical protein